MTNAQMKTIAARAAQYAVRTLDLNDRRMYAEIGRDPYQFYYEEYLDQLLTGDDQALRTWLGCEIEEGSIVAVALMKLLIRARLQKVM